jgi:transposase
VSEELWEVIGPLLPDEPAKPKGGRPRIPDRAVLTCIVYVLKSGIPWRMLPKELGCASSVTCWRRLRDWQRAGVWSRLHRVLLDELGKADLIDWSRACLDSASVAAKKGARRPALTPRPGSSRHQAAPRHRRGRRATRRATRRGAHRCQRARFQGARRTRRLHSPRAGQEGQAAQETR